MFSAQSHKDIFSLLVFLDERGSLDQQDNLAVWSKRLFFIWSKRVASGN